MNFRSAVKSIFGTIKTRVTSMWNEIGSYTSKFYSFGTDIYANDIVRACIRTLAEHSSKANVKVLRRSNGSKIEGDARLQEMIQYRPNIFMNGKDFLYKVRTLLEINNIVFIYIQRDDTSRCIGLYPMPTGEYEAVDVGGDLYIKFMYPSGIVMTHSWEDLAVLRKDYNTSDIWGDTNNAILTSLELLNTTNQGMANAIKSTANLRGLVKSTKSMLDDEDVKEIRDQFTTNYMSIANTSGVAALDSTLTFTPIEMKPQLANYKSVEELRFNIYRYYGMNENIIMSKATADERESFYESKIETFLLALSLELTNKVDRRKSYRNEIMFEANRMSYMSITDKLGLVEMVDRGAMTPNEWRDALNLSPISGGDIPIRRLDTAPTTQTAASQPDIIGSESVDETGVVDAAEEVTGKTLNGAQTQSLITVVTQFAAGTLTLGQAVNIISIAIGVTKVEAQELLEGTVNGGDKNAI